MADLYRSVDGMSSVNLQICIYRSVQIMICTDLYFPEIYRSVKLQICTDDQFYRSVQICRWDVICNFTDHDLYSSVLFWLLAGFRNFHLRRSFYNACFGMISIFVANIQSPHNHFQYDFTNNPYQTTQSIHLHQTTTFNQIISNHTFQTTHFKPRISNYLFHIIYFKLSFSYQTILASAN